MSPNASSNADRSVGCRDESCDFLPFLPNASSVEISPIAFSKLEEKSLAWRDELLDFLVWIKASSVDSSPIADSRPDGKYDDVSLVGSLIISGIRLGIGIKRSSISIFSGCKIGVSDLGILNGLSVVSVEEGTSSE